MEGSGSFCDLFESYPCFPKSLFPTPLPTEHIQHCYRRPGQGAYEKVSSESLRSPSSALLPSSPIPGLHHSVH